MRERERRNLRGVRKRKNVLVTQWGFFFPVGSLMAREEKIFEEI